MLIYYDNNTNKDIFGRGLNKKCIVLTRISMSYVKRSDAVNIANHKKIIERIKELSFSSEPQQIAISSLIKGTGVRYEAVQYMISKNMILKLPNGEGTRGITFKYQWNYGNKPLTDQVIREIYQGSRELTQSNKSKLPNHMITKLAQTPAGPVRQHAQTDQNVTMSNRPITQTKEEKKEAARVKAREYAKEWYRRNQEAKKAAKAEGGQTKARAPYGSKKEPVVDTSNERAERMNKNKVQKITEAARTTTKLFNLNHLEILKRWPLDRPTDVQIQSIDSFLFQNVTELNFHVEKSDLSIDIIARSPEGNILAMSTVSFKNVCLSFSNRGPSGAETGSLYISIVRN